MDGNCLDIDKLHSLISETVGGEWGIAWTYSLKESNDKILLTAHIQVKKTIMSVDVIGRDLVSCLTQLEYLLRMSRRRDAENHMSSVAPAEVTDEDLKRMDDYFARNMFEYKTIYARQLSQTGIMPYDTLIQTDRVRLYLIWNNTLKNKKQ